MESHKMPTSERAFEIRRMEFEAMRLPRKLGNIIHPDPGEITLEG
jgi:hypothetical protein